MKKLEGQRYYLLLMGYCSLIILAVIIVAWFFDEQKRQPVIRTRTSASIATAWADSLGLELAAPPQCSEDSGSTWRQTSSECMVHLTDGRILNWECFYVDPPGCVTR